MKSILILFLLFAFLLAGDSPYIKQAEQLLKKHQFKQVQALLQAHQNDPDALYYLSVVKLLQGQIDDALELAEEGLEKARDKDRFYEWLGDIYSVKAQTSNMFTAMMTVSKIKNNWQKALEFNPQNQKVKEKLFMFYLMAPGMAGGDEKKAQAILEEVRQNDQLLGLLLEARMQQKKKNVQQAEQLYLKAVHLAPDSIPVLFETASFFLNQKKYQQVRRWAQKMIDLQPERFTAYDLLGDMFVQKEQLDSALVQYDLALKKDPFQYRTAFKKAKILARLGRKKEARTEAQKILQAEIFFTMKKQVEKFLEELE